MKAELGKNYQPGDIRNSIKKLYEEGHYVEAIIVTHYFVSVFMNWAYDKITMSLNPSVYIDRLIEKGEFVPENKSIEQVIHEFLTLAARIKERRYRFFGMIDILFDMGVYSEGLCKDLRKFNTYRNRVAHRFLTNRLSQSELTECYELGMKLMDSTGQISRERSIACDDCFVKELKRRFGADS